MRLPDFNQLAQLARENPQELECLRAELIQDAIANATPESRQRLAGLQFQIDAQRQIHKSPLGACVKITEMMHQSFHELMQLLTTQHLNRPPTKARLLPFESATEK